VIQLVYMSWICHLMWSSTVCLDRVSRSVAYSEGSRVRIAAQRMSILSGICRDAPQSLRENAVIVASISPRPLPSTSFPLHSFVILAFNTISFTHSSELRQKTCTDPTPSPFLLASQTSQLPSKPVHPNLVNFNVACLSYAMSILTF
jgi:hypothetical protein